MSKEEVNFANLDPRDRFEILAARHLRISLPSIESIRDRDDYRSTGVSDLWQFWQVIAEAELNEIDRLSTQFKDWQASHHANYAEAARERDMLRTQVKNLESALRALREHDRVTFTQGEIIDAALANNARMQS